MLLASDLKLRTSRLEAAQQQLATEAKEHEAETALQQKQLVQLKVNPAEWQHKHMAASPCQSDVATQPIHHLRSICSHSIAAEAAVKQQQQ